MSHQHEGTGSARVETTHIDAVDPSKRHGRPRDLFPVWFSSNLSVGNAIFGALAVAVGNSLWWAVLAVLVGNVLGGTFMALHSVQGARLGVPQLIQSRGQFGFLGALLPILLAAFLYGGFFVVTAVLAGQALAAAVPSINPTIALIGLGLLSLVVALAGYRVIHLAAKWALWPLAAAVVVVSAAAVIRGDIQVSGPGFEVGAFLTAVGIMATFLLTYAPYVSDYSRYLPEDSSASACFGWTFAGIFLSATWSQLLGVILAIQFPGADLFVATREVIGSSGVATLVLLVTALAIAGNNALNLYGGMLNLITGLSSFGKVRQSSAMRLAFLVPTFVVGLWIALRATENFHADLTNFLSFLMLGFVPWGAINLLDFYLVRHGNYDVAGFFDRRGAYWHDPATWTYSGVNLQATAAYVIGVLASLPLVSNGWYVGGLAERLGGADLSWVPGLIVTGVVYLALSRSRRTSVVAPASLQVRS